MRHTTNTTPAFLSFNHIDPSGISGIQTDIEIAVSLGCHCAPIITAFNSGNTHGTKTYKIADTTLLIEQARAILEDIPITAFYVGTLGSIANMEAIHSIIRDYPKVPVIINYTCASSIKGARSTEMTAGLNTLLLPLTQLVVIAANQCRTLTPYADTDDACAASLLEEGSDFLLMQYASTLGTHNQFGFYSKHGLINSYRQTIAEDNLNIIHNHLAGAISAYLAHELPISDTVQQGLRYCEKAQSAARKIGSGNPIYHRLYWTTPP